MTKNPFMNFDLGDMMKMMGENDFLKSMMGGAAKPTNPLDPAALMEAQRKNLDTLVAVNKSAGESMAKMAEAHSKLMADTFETVKGYAAKAGDSPSTDATKNVEEAQAVMQKAMTTFAGLGEIQKGATDDVVNIISERMKSSMSELEQLMKKFKI